MLKRSLLLGVIAASLGSGACTLAGEAARPLGTSPAAQTQPALTDRQKLADEFVAHSARYLHQSKLQRGMKGYGLTVMEGTRIQKFEVTILSVLRNWGPRQDVILCRLAGLDLEKSGVIQGMSGSPVFVTDPADGKDKIVGAVAYGWPFQSQPVCGLQPIAQMLAISGVPLGKGDAYTPPPCPPDSAGPGDARASAHGLAAGELDRDFVRAALDPHKTSFATFTWPPAPHAAPAGNSAKEMDETGTGLVPLSTPVMIAGCRPQSLAQARKLFAGTGLVPMQGGSVGSADTAAAGQAKLEPGGGLAIPLVSGDADYAAVGTVTDVLGDYVLGFGHPFFSEGAIDFPMGPAYVHTVIASLATSFKLGSPLGIQGALRVDESTAVGGTIGAKARTIPVDISVRWLAAPAGAVRSQQRFHYEIIRHRALTPRIISVLLGEAVRCNRELPPCHTVSYDAQVEFDGLGRFRAANRSSGMQAMDVDSDLVRPVAVLTNTDLGPPAFPTAVTATITIEPVQTTATVLEVALERNAYKPGQTVKGRVMLLPFRAERKGVEVSLPLPDDLPDGEYTLTVCDATAAAMAEQEDLPHRFAPRTVEQLFAAIKEVVARQADHLYLRLPLPDSGGLAVRKQELEHLPASLANILKRSAPADASTYRRSLTADVATPYVLTGSAEARFTVARHPQEEKP